MKTSLNQTYVVGKPKIEFPEKERSRLVSDCESYPASSGKTQYLRYLNGEKLTYREAVLAKCAECCCGYADGRYDCRIPACPLYQFMPYKGLFGNEQN